MLFLTYCTQCCSEHGAARVFSQKCRHSSWYISRSGTAVSYSSYVFNFWGNIYAIFHRGCINLVFHQQYTGFPFLHILTSTYYLLSFWYEPFWQVWGDMLSWFWFAFPWWLVMLNLFSCAYWPAVYFPCNTKTSCLPMFPVWLYHKFAFHQYYCLHNDYMNKMTIWTLQIAM